MITTEIKKVYRIDKKVTESPTVSTLYLTLPNEKLPLFYAGQYINIYFPELHTPEGKAYSVSDAPHTDRLVITVKAIGEFSKKLCALHEGDVVTGSLPYGYFYSESKNSTLVMIAGGIGVTPFRSMIIDSLASNPLRKLILFYTARSDQDLIFKQEFDRLQREHTQFKAFYFVTREKSIDPTVFERRITIADILSNKPKPNITDREFLMCGSIPFVRDMWKGLRDMGVSEDVLYTEAFFSH